MFKRVAASSLMLAGLCAFNAFSEEVPFDVVESYQQACDLNDDISCFSLGVSYYFGKGVKQDYFKAKEYFQKACDLNNGFGFFALGNLYYAGKGVRQDTKLAKEYFGKACDLKVQVGCDWYSKLNTMGE